MNSSFSIRFLAQCNARREMFNNFFNDRAAALDRIADLELAAGHHHAADRLSAIAALRAFRPVVLA